jgi:vitamin B12 transporter
MMLRRLALGGLLLATPALAQEQDPDEIVVTGRGLDPPPGESLYSTAVVNIGQDGEAARLEDILRDAAGVAQFRRSDSRSAHPTSQGVTMRGLGGNASSRALVILDGVPQSDPFGGWVAFAAYRPERLESIRVTRGGGSGYSGPGALAGTLYLESASASTIRRLRAGADLGSRGSVDAYAIAAAGSGPGFATLAAHYARGAGFVPAADEDRGPADRAAPYRQASVAARGVIDIGGAELQASLSGSRDRRDRGIDFTAIRSDGADASVRIVGRGHMPWSALAYVQTRAFASGFASIDDARTAATPTLDQYNVPSTGVGGRIELQPRLGKGAMLRIGADTRRVSGSTHERFSYVAGLPTRLREAGGASLTAGTFADLSYRHGALLLDAGGRLDRWWIAAGRLTERALGATGPALTDLAFAERSGWEATGRIGAGMRVANHLMVRAAGYRGWRLPTLNELYRPFRVGADATAANAALAPERLWGGEIGTAFGRGGLTFQADVYWNRLEGAIVNVTAANGPGIFPGVGFVSAAGVYRRRENVDAVEARGAEFNLQYTLGAVGGRRSFARFAYTFADSRIHASGIAAALDGLRPAQTARHVAALTLGIDRSWGDVSLIGRYLGSQFEDDQNLRRLADVVTFDAAARISLDREFAIRIRGENLFDARVEAGISGPGVIERASPRTLWIGIGYRQR